MNSPLNGQSHAIAALGRGRPGLEPEQAQRVHDALQELLRTRHNGNISALARELELSQSAASQLISKKNAPSFSTAERVAKAFGVEVVNLLSSPAEPARVTALEEKGMIQQGFGRSMPLIAERLQWLLKNKGMSARELSLKAGLAPSHVGAMMRRLGDRVAFTSIAKIARAAGVNVAWLAAGQGEPFARPYVPETDTADAAAGPPSDLASRTWYAYHCLRRRPNGEPPSYRSLEREHGLPLALFSKLFGRERQAVAPATLAKLAGALGVSERWLVAGEGAAPTPTGPVPFLDVPEATPAVTGLPEPSAAKERSCVVAFIRGLAASSPHRDELLQLARMISLGQHMGDTA